MDFQRARDTFQCLFARHEKIKSTVKKLSAPALDPILLIADTVTHMKIYGVTPPISEAKPSEREWYLNRSLNDVLVKERMVESEERTKLR